MNSQMAKGTAATSTITTSAVRIELRLIEIFTRVGLLTEIVSKLRERDRQTEVDRRLRRDRSELPIRHPLPRDKDTHWWQPRTHNRSSEPDAQRQHRRVMTTPTHRPISLRGSQVPFVPQMKREDGLELKCILWQTIGRRVREGDRVQGNEPYQQPGNPAVNCAERRSGLPRALSGALRGGGGKHKSCPGADQKAGFLPVGPRQYCNIEDRQVTELGPSSTSGALYCHQLKCWADQLRKREERLRWYARNQWPNEKLVGLGISEAHLGRARSRSIVGRCVAIPDQQLWQSRKRVGEVPF